MQLLLKKQYYEEEIKKSKFIVKAFPVTQVQQAMQLLQENMDPQATHNCWAYKIGQEYRFSDDGEPGGTAGRPILQAIESQQLMDVFVLVIRYFGGVKLGTGGLVRAYGGCAAKCLQQAETITCVPKTTVYCTCPFSEIERLRAKLTTVTIEKEDYDDKGVIWQLLIPDNDVSIIEQWHQNITRGQAIWSVKNGE
ncbi:IMPACT family protein [Basilea psittacipulmonis]|uniref:Thymidylate synthase n=1 Tax=Basilea psittacipulmonis DSM 24701 TaxID=1072685 RepID=A0A077DDW7_9BURK|nr:YigZ family protein [Basilea psittacipulmonis]AIL32814.1 thymidylate synthase [Basilea psittacipulmonis DSM 24701]